MVKIVSVDSNYADDLKHFLNNAGSSLNTFRYFDSRSIAVLDNHLLTLIAYINEDPIGYGHLDKDLDTVWLGVAVSEKVRGKGVGRLIISRLLDYADNNDLSIISLTVDIRNQVAINLYEKLGFKIIGEQMSKRYLMQRSKNE